MQKPHNVHFAKIDLKSQLTQSPPILQACLLGQTQLTATRVLQTVRSMQSTPSHHVPGSRKNTTPCASCSASHHAGLYHHQIITPSPDHCTRLISQSPHRRSQSPDRAKLSPSNARARPKKSSTRRSKFSCTFYVDYNQEYITPAPRARGGYVLHH